MLTNHAHHTAAEHRVSRILTGVALGGIAVGAGIILTPYLLPAVGIGSAEMAQEAMWVLHNAADAGGSGLAGAVSRALAAVPLIGTQLAAGGLFNALATGVVGVGGVLLGNYIAKGEDGKKRIKWGNVIKTAALITSALIALPTVLTSIGTGLIFLSTLAGEVGVANSMIALVESTIGTMGGMEGSLMGFSGLAAAIPHFLTCGISLLPMAVSLSLYNKNGDEKPHETFAGKYSKSRFNRGAITSLGV